MRERENAYVMHPNNGSVSQCQLMIDYDGFDGWTMCLFRRDVIDYI